MFNERGTGDQVFGLTQRRGPMSTYVTLKKRDCGGNSKKRNREKKGNEKRKTVIEGLFHQGCSSCKKRGWAGGEEMHKVTLREWVSFSNRNRCYVSSKREGLAGACQILQRK